MIRILEFLFNSSDAIMDDWDLPDSIFITGGRFRDAPASSSTPGVLFVLVGHLCNP